MSAAVAAAAAAALNRRRCNPTTSQRDPQTRAQNVYNIIGNSMVLQAPLHQPIVPSRYESQKRRDWVAFHQYLRNHRPPLALNRCSGAHVLEFLKYLDQFGKTKVHSEECPFFGQPNPSADCPCPLRQAWGSLDALVGRLRAAFEENGGCPETNPFGGRAVSLYLREVRNAQAKARGIAYEKKKRRKPPPTKLHADNYDDSDQIMGHADPSSSEDLNSNGSSSYQALHFH